MKTISFVLLVFFSLLLSGCFDKDSGTDCTDYYVSEVGGCDKDGLCAVRLTSKSWLFSRKFVKMSHPVFGQEATFCREK